MKIYIVVTTKEDDGTEVEVFKTPEEATNFIRAELGDIIIDLYNDHCLNEIRDYLNEVDISSYEDGNSYYAEHGPKGFKTYLEVVEKEIDVK